MNIAVIFAGGTGQRMKHSAKPKQFLELYGKPIIIYTLEVFQAHPMIDGIVIPCVADWIGDLEDMIERFHIKKVLKVLEGGADTQASKMNALAWLKGKCAAKDIILLHDAVRPLVTEKLITDNINTVLRHGSAVTAVPFTETGIVSDDDETTHKTIIRNTLYIAKAPQSFYFEDVYSAHETGKNMSYTITVDTCSLMTELGKTLHIVPCETTNIKITTPEDFFIFKALMDLRESADIWGL